MFTLHLAGQPRISITRHNPAFPVIANTVGSVVYRVAFNHAVSGVTTGAFQLATTETVAGAVASVSADSGSTFDVTVGGISGAGTLRLVLKPDSGVVDAGGTPEAGHTAGQVYTLVVPTVGSGVWVRPETGGLWSDGLNWLMR